MWDPRVIFGSHFDRDRGAAIRPGRPVSDPRQIALGDGLEEEAASAALRGRRKQRLGEVAQSVNIHELAGRFGTAGSRDRLALIGQLAQFALTGDLNVQRDNQKLTEPADIQEALAAVLGPALTNLANQGLLM